MNKFKMFKVKRWSLKGGAGLPDANLQIAVAIILTCLVEILAIYRAELTIKPAALLPVPTSPA
jgi:hypothetical protein